MDTLSDRISAALAKSGMSQADLAKRCGIKGPSVNNWITGKTKSLKYDTAVLAAKALNVSVNWLTTGKGSMEKAEGETAEEPSEANVYHVVDTERIENTIRAIRSILVLAGFDHHVLGTASELKEKLQSTWYKAHLKDTLLKGFIDPLSSDITDKYPRSDLKNEHEPT